MQTLNGTPLFATAPRFAAATPVLFLDQDKAAPKTDDKEKTAPKPAPTPDRKLSDFELEAIKRIAKLDTKLSEKLAAKLPKKKTVAELVAYIRNRIGKLDDARRILDNLAEDKLTKKKGLEKAFKRLDKIEEELLHIGRFHAAGVLPKWYLKLLKERKKKKNKAPTAKPADTAPGAQPGGTFGLADRLFLNLLAA